MIKATLIATLLAAPVYAETLTVKPFSGWSSGGYLAEYMDKRDSVEAVRIEGRCASSCGVFLSHPNVCVTRRAKLVMHGMTIRNKHLADWSWQELYAAQLGNAKLGQTFLTKYANSKRTGKPIRGSELIEVYGIKECEG